MSVQKITDYKHFAAFLRIMVHSLDRYKHPVAVRMRTDGRIRCSTVQKHPISGSIKDVFGCGGQISVHFCHFLFAQVPQRADWRTFSPFFVLQDAPEVARGPLLNEPHPPEKRRKDGRSPGAQSRPHTTCQKSGRKLASPPCETPTLARKVGENWQVTAAEGRM